MIEHAENKGLSYNVAVVGAGAIGESLAAHFQAMAIPHTLLKRGSPPKSLASCPLVLFTVKAYSLENALAQWLPELSSRALLVVCCNGDVDGVLARAVEADRRPFLRRGIITFGSRLIGEKWQMIGEEGHLVIGDPTGQSEPEPVETFLISRSPRVRWEPAIQNSLIEKWIANTVINTIAAAYRLPTNGDILDHHRTEFMQALKEAIDYARTRWPTAVFDEAMLEKKFLRILQDTADNENSMAADIRLGRQTELRYLAGLVPNKPCFPILNRLVAMI